MRSLPASEVNAYVSQHIRMRRIHNKMTQKQLADKIGVTFQQVQKYEKGTDRVSLDRLIQMAAALDVAPALLLPSRALVNGDGGVDLSSLLNSSDAVRMARAFQKVCPKWHPFLLHIVEACADRWYPSCEE